MKLTDYHDGRLHVGDQILLPALPVRQRLDAYLQYRQATWPTSTTRTWSGPTTARSGPAWIAIQLGMSP